VASGGCGPGESAGAGLLEGPSWGLFHLVVVSAKGGEVAQASFAAGLVSDGVVGVALGRGAAAAGEDAGGVAEGDQVAQGSRGLVGGCFPGVVAVAAGQWREGEGPCCW